MPDTIAIICTLDEIIPHSLGETNGTRHFSLNLSVSLTNDSVGGVPASVEIFQPWKWRNVGLKVLATNGTDGAVPVAFAVTAPAALPSVSGALEVRFANPDPLYFRWADQPGVAGIPGPDENWSRVLAHASTWPAPVPANLNLSFHVTIAGGAVLNGKRLFIAPEFIANNVSYALQGLPAPPGAGLSAYTWSYGAGMAAFQPEYVVQALPADTDVKKPGSFFNFNTWWIATEDGKNSTPASPNPESNASDDWRFTLESKAAEAFDLVQRVLVVLRQDQANASLTPPKPTLLDGADLGKGWAGLVAALRDNADDGLRYAPDGLNTFRYVLGRPDVRAAASTTTDSDYAAAINTMESALTNATPPGGKWTVYWNSLLTPGLVGIDIGKVPGTEIALIDAADTLQSALAGTDTLAVLLFRQWDDVLKGPDSQHSTFWDGIKAAVNNELEALSTSRLLRSRMLQANLGGNASDLAIWKAFTRTPVVGYTNEIGAVLANLQALIPAWFRARFGVASTDPTNEALFADRNPPITGWPVDLSALLGADASQFKDRLFHDSANQPTRAPQPVIIQIDNTHDQEGDAPGSLKDSSRKIAGVGLLVREQPHNGNQTFWACANIANLYTGPAETDLCATNVIVPIRQKKRNNLKQPVLAYNGASLVSAADSNPASDDFHKSSYPPQNVSGLFSYRPGAALPASITTTGNMLNIPPNVPPDGMKLDDWKRIPSLKINRTYDFLPFLIGNNGALPFQFAAPGTPAIPLTPAQFAASWTTAALTGYIRTVTYKRRVGVGPARLKRKPNATVGGSLFPAIPSTVVPIARDVLPAVTTNTTPLLLLWKPNTPNPAADFSTFTFTLRPPACDHETWDRWVAGLDDPAANPDPTKTVSYRNTRIAVATTQGLFPPKSMQDAKDVDPNSAPDLSIDDPAVTGLNLTMTRIFPPPSEGGTTALALAAPVGNFAPKPSASSVDASTAKTLMAAVQDDGVTITCSIQAGNATLNPDGTITIPPGQVWSLTVAPAIAATGNFEGPAVNPATFNLVIETVSAGAFDPATPNAEFQADLWKNLNLALDAKRSLNVTLKSTQPDNWALIHNIDVRKQAWRWMGRPLGAYPADWQTHQSGDVIDADPVLTPPNSRMWELASFAERADDDCAVTQCAVNFTAVASRALHTADLSANAAAQYYRVGIDVHSRYEGLPGLTLVPVRAASAHAAGAAFTFWRRCVVPPLIPAVVPKPKVVMAIPLMRPAAPSKSPAIVVIANEQCFDQWGLAEELVAVFDQARDPAVPLTVPADQANPIPEIGPNPILSVHNFADTKIKLSVPVPADPMGTTFDQATSSPLFANTTYLLDPSKLGLPISGVEHLQARVRFQRIVNGSYFGAAGTKVQSDPTDSFLIEFQPGSQQVNSISGGVVTPVNISDLTCQTSFVAAPSATASATAVLTFSNAAGPVTLQAGPTDSALFDLSHLQLWALMMRRIKDVTGNPQLTFVNWFVQDTHDPAGRFIVQADDITAIDSSDCIVFLMEILSVPTIDLLAFQGGIKAAADLLFPPVKTGQQPQDTLARIARPFDGVPVK